MQAQERRALTEAIVREVSDVITVVDADGLVRFVNEATAPVLGQDPRASTGRAALDWVHPDDRAMVLERRAWLRGGVGRTTTTVVRVTGPDGGWRHVETRGVNLLDDPDVRGLLYVTRDVEDRARAEVSLVHALATSRAVADLGLLALRTPALDDVVAEALRRVSGLLGAVGTTLLLPDADGVLAVRAHVGRGGPAAGTPWPAEGTPAGRALAEGHPVVADDLRGDDRFAVPVGLLDGVRSSVDVPVQGPTGPLGVLVVTSAEPRLFSPVDVTLLESVGLVLSGALARERREQAAVVEALHDPLTGLPTRPLLLDRLEHALERTRRGGGEVALLVVDLDRFKAVNDRWGHAAGDQVLAAMGPRIAACVRAVDTAARYGGDEFVVLCEDEVHHVGVAQVAARIRRACLEPVVLHNGESVLLSCSIGIAWSVEEGADAQALLAAADAAMYREKQAR